MDTSKTGTGRRRLTSKQRQRLLTKFHQSQLAQRESANEHAIGMSTLSKWLRLERDEVPAKVKFQEVRLPSPVSKCEANRAFIPIYVFRQKTSPIRLSHAGMPQQFAKVPPFRVLLPLDDGGMFFCRDCPLVLDDILWPL
jgi:hypothetical protein